MSLSVVDDLLQWFRPTTRWLDYRVLLLAPASLVCWWMNLWKDIINTEMWIQVATSSYLRIPNIHKSGRTGYLRTSQTVRPAASWALPSCPLLCSNTMLAFRLVKFVQLCSVTILTASSHSDRYGLTTLNRPKSREVSTNDGIITQNIFNAAVPTFSETK